MYYTTLTQTGGGRHETVEISCQAHGSGKEAAVGNSKKRKPFDPSDHSGEYSVVTGRDRPGKNNTGTGSNNHTVRLPGLPGIPGMQTIRAGSRPKASAGVDRAVELGVVEHISAPTVGKLLEKPTNRI
jgi:hypothetical protein